MGLIGVALVALLYYFKFYNVCLIVILFTAINGVLGALRSLKNPRWYAYKRLEAGLDVDILNPEKGVKLMLITKIIFTPLLLFLAWHIAGKAGYI